MPDNATVAQAREILQNMSMTCFSFSQDASSALSSHSSKPSKPKENTINGEPHPAHGTGKCSKCGKIASLICNGCKGLPAARGNSTIVTWYCIKVCQTEHWPFHKKECKAAKTRQLLYRVANLTKELFYIHSETTFAWAYFKNIDSYGSIRAVYVDQKKSDERKTLLVPFSTVTDLVSDKKEQEAYLSHLKCNEAIARFGPLLAGRLKGTAHLQVLDYEHERI